MINFRLSSFKNVAIDEVLQYEPYNLAKSLIYDYEQFVLNYETISLTEFIQDWNCLPNAAVEQLRKDDIIYDVNGCPYIVLKSRYTVAYDGTQLFGVHCYGYDYPNYKNEYYLETGEIYSSNVYNSKIKYIKPKGDKICPTLITKTNQHQN